MNRRQLLTSLMSGLGMTACSSFSSSLSSTLKLEAGLFRGPHRSASDYPVSAEQLARIPYSKLGVRVGQAPRLVMLLSSIDGDKLTWVSEDRVRFVTLHGRLIETAGMPRDVHKMVWREADPLLRLARAGEGSAEAQCLLDYRKEAENDIQAKVRMRVAGTEVIEILGESHPTTVVEETFDIPSWRWEASNRYWVDPQSGIVWRSQQQYCPEVGTYELEWLAQT